MATGALRPVDMRPRLEDVFARAKGRLFQLAIDPRVQRKMDELLLVRKRLVGDGNGKRASVKYVREFDYAMAGKPIHITDAVDISLVKPRVRKYETAGAASSVAASASTKAAPRATSTEKQP